jgi:H-type lectin domain
MTEFFNWLSVNPMATVFFGLAVIFVVAICAVGFLQGREITFWPPKISSQPKAFRRMVQIGDVHLPANKPKNFYDGTYNERRGIHAPVKFQFPYKKYVDVRASLRMMDAGDGREPRINRVLVSAANIKLEGFEVYSETWADSNLYDAAATWIAVGE